MNHLILHIPHASTNIPDLTGYMANNEIIDAELLKLTDWYTDELFTNATDSAVVAPFSRVFCDVERFTDDSREAMAKVTTLDSGQPLRQLNPAYREEMIRHYYRPHHKRLNRATREELAANGHCLIIDCHSFPDRPLQRDSNQNTPRPDFGIGTDPFHTPTELAEQAAAFFRERGYTSEINSPYSGALVPEAYYRKNRRVQTLMLEVNRKLYLRNESSEKSGGFESIKALVQEFLNHIKKSF